MATYPNTGLTQSNSVVYGSCKLEISEDSGNTWVNIGLARGVTFTENIQSDRIQADNGPDVAASYVSDQTATISFNALEVYAPTLNILRGGIDTLTQVTTGSTTATDSYTTGGTSAEKFIALSNQGSGSTGITISSVKQVSTGGTTTTLTDYDDYIESQYGSIVGITPLASTGSAYDATSSLVISYSYDKVVQNILKSGGKSTVTPKWFKFTNAQVVNGTTKYRYITVYSAAINEGLNLAFKSSNDTDPVLECPISLIATIDATRTVGDQLFMIEDNVGVAS